MLEALHGGARSAEQSTMTNPERARGSGASASARRPSIPAETREEGGPLPAKARLRVLVVDDNQDAAEMLSEWIAMDGHETSVAHDGASALAEIERGDVDVVLLDIGLPVMDGYEVARLLRERGLLDRMMVVALTGYGQAMDRARSSSAGFHAHLVKPVDLDALSALLASVARQRGK